MHGSVLFCVLLFGVLLFGPWTCESALPKGGLEPSVQLRPLDPEERILEMFAKEKRQKPRKKSKPPKYTVVSLAPRDPEALVPDTEAVEGVSSSAGPPDPFCVSVETCVESCRREATNSEGDAWHLTDGPDVKMCHVGCCLRGGLVYTECSRHCWDFVKMELGDHHDPYYQCYRGCAHRCANKLYSAAEKVFCEPDLQMNIDSRLGAVGTAAPPLIREK